MICLAALFDPHGPNRLRRRADKRDARLCAGFGKSGVFGEKTVAGMDGLRTGGTGGGEKGFWPQIALSGRSGPDVAGFVGQSHVQGPGVGVGVNRNGADAEGSGRADDATGDLAPIGNENFLEHGRYPFTQAG